METQLRAALINWLKADPALTAELNSVAEEAPVAVAPPWLGLVASASASVDWSTKIRKGREIRVALELHVRGAGSEMRFAAIGLADEEPVMAQLTNSGSSLRPLPPVHPRLSTSGDGGVILQWTRRARGAWHWVDELATPLVEPTESYLVGLGDTAQPAAV